MTVAGAVPYDCPLPQEASGHVPHVFVNRPRLLALTRRPHELEAHFFWETVNAVLYKIGGVVFMIGSVLFHPAFAAYADLGAWTFFFGSLLYLVVTGHDSAEAWRHWLYRGRPDLRETLEMIAAPAYLSGTILFTIGSLFFLSVIGWLTAGAWCFVVGSLLFVLGACINVLQIVQARSLMTLQLMNLTAVSFVAGSILFAVASVPYLWTVEAPHDRILLYGFLAWQYLFGSALFLLGGIFNYWRATLLVRSEAGAKRAG